MPTTYPKARRNTSQSSRKRQAVRRVDLAKCPLQTSNLCQQDFSEGSFVKAKRVYRLEGNLTKQGM